MAKKKAARLTKRAASKSEGGAASAPQSIGQGALPESDPKEKPFTPEVLDRTAIAIPLLDDIVAENKAIEKGAKAERRLYSVIIDLHREFPGGRQAARDRVRELVKAVILEKGRTWNIDESKQGISEGKSRLSEHYLFGVFDGRVIQELIRRDSLSAP